MPEYVPPASEYPEFIERRTITVTRQDLLEGQTVDGGAKLIRACLAAVQRNLGTPWFESPIRGVLLEDAPPHRALVLPYGIAFPDSQIGQAVEPFEIHAQICGSSKVDVAAFSSAAH